MVTIDLYNYTGRTYSVNKVLPTATTLSGVLRDKTNVMMPEITLRLSAVFNYNYCYIRDINRYYYVVGVTILDNNTYLVRLSLDVLKTYAADVLTAVGTITESDDADKYISSRQKIYDVRPTEQKVSFSSPNQFDSTGSLIMVTLKGN